jgi:hypothetical protein
MYKGCNSTKWIDVTRSYKEGEYNQNKKRAFLLKVMALAISISIEQFAAFLRIFAENSVTTLIPKHVLCPEYEQSFTEFLHCRGMGARKPGG